MALFFYCAGACDELAESWLCGEKLLGNLDGVASCLSALVAPYFFFGAGACDELAESWLCGEIPV